MTAVAEVDPETQAKHARLKVLQDELAAASLRLVKAVNPVLQVCAGCLLALLYLSWSDPQTHRPLCNWYYWWVTKETRANQVGQKSKLHLTAQSSEVPEQLTVLATSLDSVWQEMGQNGRPKLLKGATASNATGKDLANKFL